MIKTDNKIIKYDNLEKIKQRREKWSTVKRKVVLVTGCYDYLHLGHIIFLNYAKKQGDILVVGVGSDETIRKLKGEGRPMVSERLRARTVAALEIVDFVVILKEKLTNFNIDHSILVSKLRPEIYVVPITDANLEGKKKLVEKFGGKLITCRRLPPNHLKGGISSTRIIKRVWEE